MINQIEETLDLLSAINTWTFTHENGVITGTGKNIHYDDDEVYIINFNYVDTYTPEYTFDRVESQIEKIGLDEYQHSAFTFNIENYLEVNSLLELENVLEKQWDENQDRDVG